MGTRLFDQYSLLHFAVGIIFFFWNISWQTLLIIHTLFELVENTPLGMSIINRYFTPWWPGGKDYSDSWTNMIGDTISAIFGWFFSYYIST